ncbi:transcobalamin beta a [Esox lucius]|uniref:Transcobalamin-like C-terminal domain-containing protein n=1 Tax=Esox lucius TaxID=8010 RepID=A0A3P8YE09_ESOLU|nr:transcobalamin beta a [Esox lucius]
MSMMTTATLLSAALLLLVPGILTKESVETSPIQLMIVNSISNAPNVTHTTEIVFRGILLGAMRRLQETNTDFKFTYREDPNYGPFLVSVNGVAGDDAEHTYWELLVKNSNGVIIRPDVGIGCYIPNPNDTIILKFTKW